MIESAEKQEDYANMPHVLVVDDDKRICDLVTRYLSEQGFIVMSAADTSEARALLGAFEFDVLVVDVMMPGQTGFEFTKELRGGEDFSDLPVLLLTALGEAGDRIEGLEAGADDYLAKPFEPRELVLRLNAILRRVAVRKDDVIKPFEIGRWRYDPQSDVLEDDSKDGGERVKLTAMEANLLKALAKRKGEILSRDELAELCGLDAGERTIDVQVTRLRRKIEDDSKTPRYLQTVRGKGYVLHVGQ